MTKSIWRKILFSLGVLLITTAAVVQETTIDVQPGIIIIEGDYAWMCFPPGGGSPMCVRVHKSNFCLIEVVAPGRVVCIKPMIAEGQ